MTRQKADSAFDSAKRMDAFADAVEKLAQQPIKGEVPTNEDISKVTDVASTFQPSIPDERGRQIPTQEEVSALVAAVAAADSTKRPNMGE